MVWTKRPSEERGISQVVDWKIEMNEERKGNERLERTKRKKDGTRSVRSDPKLILGIEGERRGF